MLVVEYTFRIVCRHTESQLTPFLKTKIVNKMKNERIHEISPELEWKEHVRQSYIQVAGKWQAELQG